MTPLKLAVLASGSGSNLQAILDAVAAGRLQADLRGVICNVPGARALERAEAAGVPALCLDHRAFADRAAFDAELVARLRELEAEWVALAGFMRILGPAALDAFPHRVVNVHPALLPAFPGLHAPRQALQKGVRVTGCTVHLVDAGTDTGPILAQAAVPIHAHDDEAALTARIQQQEHRLYPQTLQWIAEGRLVRDARGFRLDGLPAPEGALVAPALGGGF